MMESTIDLILKGHFETLKEKANSQKLTSASEANLIATLHEVADYLKNDDEKEAKRLRNKVMNLLYLLEQNESIKMQRKPMKKAGGKKGQKQNRKAM